MVLYMARNLLRKWPAWHVQETMSFLGFPILRYVDARLGRVDEFEVLPIKSMAYGKVCDPINSSKINGLVLIRQHALVSPGSSRVQNLQSHPL
jgi:hypothetical protein